MRRILSAIIAIAMIAAMLPAFALAADTTTDAGITLTYEVTKNFGSWGNTTVRFDSFTYEVSNGLWEYYGNTNNLPSADKSTTINWSGLDGMQMRSGYWAIKINVPKSGIYTPKINHKKYREASLLNLYLIKADRPLVETDMNEDTLFGVVNCYDKDVEKPTSQITAELDPRYIEAGEYYFVYYCGEKQSSGGTGWVFFGNITLDGNGTDTVLASVFTDKTIAVPMGQTTKVTPKLYMSDGTEATGEYTLSYASDNATVSVANDGTITPNSEGSAVVTVSAVNEAGYTIKDKVDVVAVNGPTIKYDLIKHVINDLGYTQNKYDKGEDTSLKNLTEEVTDGFYSYFDGNDSDGSRVKYYNNIQLGYMGAKIAFKINVPVAGYYNIVHDIVNVCSASSNAARRNLDVGIYVAKDEMDTSAGAYIGKYCPFSDDYEDGEKRQVTSGTVYFEEAGSYIITLKIDTLHGSGSPFTGIYAFYLVGGTKNALMNGKISSTADSINVDEGESATVSATGFLSKDSSAATFTYSSNNTSVATVDATTGVVTPIKEGKATITATANAEIANKLTTDITVTENKPGEAVTDTTVSVGIIALEGGSVATNLSSAVSEVEIGTKVIAEATASDGYEFAYWKDSNGKVLSTNAKETFVINVNTSIKAYFEKLAAESDATAPVYFYNGNGEALGSKTIEKGKTFADVEKPKNVSLTGFEFDKWSIADNAIINSLTRAVALFKDTNNTYTVKVGNEAVATGKKYGESVTVKATEADFTCWKLGEKVMSYDKEFTFNVYGDITLTKVCEGAAEAIPTVVLDKIDGEYFLTYNVPAGYTKIEAGILFATSGTPDITSFYAKATEKTGSGQFTAKPNGSESIARGYVIFRDDDENIRVIYAE